MWRLIVLVVALAAYGCGGVGDAVAPRPTPIPECPEGTPFVRARDIVGRPVPAGYELVSGDTQVLRTFATQFRQRIGEAWRGYDARVLVRKGKIDGAAVVVINAKDQTGGNSLVAGVEKAA